MMSDIYLIFFPSWILIQITQWLEYSQQSESNEALHKLITSKFAYGQNSKRIYSHRSAVRSTWQHLVEFAAANSSACYAKLSYATCYLHQCLRLQAVLLFVKAFKTTNFEL